MSLSSQQKRKLKFSFRLILFGVVAGLFFVVLSDGLDEIYPLVNGAIIGFLIALSASVFELFVYEKRIRKQRFIIVLLSRSFFYLFLIVTIMISEIGIARMLKNNLTFNELLVNKDFNNYIYGGEFITSVFYAIALVVMINFTRQISRKLGDGVITSFVSGRNFHPREVNKVFMFLSIPASNVIIDQINRMNFHRFINEVAYDITIPVLSHKGVIYQYVEDEMVIAWKVDNGISKANSIRCFFEIKDKIHECREKYLKKFGVIPSFKAAIHCGKVVKGEIGFIKTEIVYHGDVMNTTSRILGAAYRLGKEILISSSYLKSIDLPVIYQSEKCGDIKLKGKKAAMDLYSIEEVDMKSMAFS